jgi:hypothetical protein
MALDHFYVDWNTEVPQDFSHETEARAAVPESPIKYFFDWIVPARGQGHKDKPIGERFKYLFYNNLGLPDEAEWQFERPMGKGSFGAVGLWTKVNEKQERVDVGCAFQTS